MRKPRIHPKAYVARTATVIGNVVVEEEASVWFGCVLRAEEAPIVVGPRTNVQDLTLIHTDQGQPCRLGAWITVGHRAVLHGATIEDGALVGIGAIVLDGAVVGKEAIIGAGAVVTEGTVIPPRTLALGVPAEVVRELQTEDLRRAQETAVWYAEQAQAYRKREEGIADE
jgi:carbonic anhydrase/acetyltransferase-like protein (isoleucine patch superfamily)